MRFFVAKLRVGLCLVGIASLVGCSLVPGTYLGLTPPKIDETAEPYVYDAEDTRPLEDRVDIFSITASTMTKQDQGEPAGSQLKSPAALSSEQDYQYLVGPQDVLHITVWNHPEINNPSGTMNAQLVGRTVNADGAFFFPYAGYVPAAGRTVQQIREELTKRLSQVLVEPQVDVSVLSYRSKRAFVLGQVQRPGLIPITDVPLTITDLISQAGGVTPEADLSSATLMRDGKSQPVDLYALYYEGDVTQNLRLRNGDILTIPENRYKKIFVLGEVGKPQSIVMPRGRMTLAEAISDSGGFNPLSSNAGQLYVIRDGKNGRVQVWHLNAASPDALVLADRFNLKPRDIVYVDPAGVTRFSRIVNNIIPSAGFIRATVQN
jgi:Periplasmic protein involved in polysaccharide export